MANAIPLTEELAREWVTWVNTKSGVVRNNATNYPGFKLYKFKGFDAPLIVITAYNDTGHVTVLVSARYNLVPYEHVIHGVDPTTLEEADLPTGPTGAAWGYYGAAIEQEGVVGGEVRPVCDACRRRALVLLTDFSGLDDGR